VLLSSWLSETYSNRIEIKAENDQQKGALCLSATFDFQPMFIGDILIGFLLQFFKVTPVNGITRPETAKSRR
jgi:hypothetical protein